MPDFNIDDIKKTWQEQKVQPKYGNSDILEMLNRKSRNYVKYIFWISIAEFLFFLGMNILYVFKSEESNSFFNILKRLGIEKTLKLQADFEQLYFAIKIVSLLMTATFVYLFYKNYEKINIEANLKKFILQIIRFKKTVNAFILSNIVLLVLFMTVLTLFIFMEINAQNITLSQSKLLVFFVGLIFSMVLMIILILLYYRLVYGIIMKKLGKNLQQLKEIESNEN